MPHYDYRCDQCGYIFEVFQKISEDRLSLCPECSGSITRLIGGGAGIIFKGNGFYSTDYRKSAPPVCEKKSADNPVCEACPKVQRS